MRHGLLVTPAWAFNCHVMGTVLHYSSSFRQKRRWHNGWEQLPGGEALSKKVLKGIIFRFVARGLSALPFLRRGVILFVPLEYMFACIFKSKPGGVYCWVYANVVVFTKFPPSNNFQQKWSSALFDIEIYKAWTYLHLFQGWHWVQFFVFCLKISSKVCIGCAMRSHIDLIEEQQELEWENNTTRQHAHNGSFGCFSKYDCCCFKSSFKVKVVVCFQINNWLYALCLTYGMTREKFATMFLNGTRIHAILRGREHRPKSKHYCHISF